MIDFYLIDHLAIYSVNITDNYEAIYGFSNHSENFYQYNKFDLYGTLYSCIHYIYLFT